MIKIKLIFIKPSCGGTIGVEFKTEMESGEDGRVESTMVDRTDAELVSRMVFGCASPTERLPWIYKRLFLFVA